ncbi:hypothetical protein [Halomicrobium salinisoli]|uniref:8-oxoguanine DNA glycosylase OGG fold protein n=1 Tax=Halomicrobium salinisoli TaxID=2878391 RepID=UPI001CF06D6D|nr:hypothetical protein [Halomicrobium salinisoli]
MPLTEALVREKAREFENHGVADLSEDDVVFERTLFESLPSEFQSRSAGLGAVEKVIEWKQAEAANRRAANINHLQKSTDDEVRTAVSEALDRDSIAGKIEALDEDDRLRGIGFKTASAILMFADPDRFTVIDERAMRTLNQHGYLDLDPESTFSSEDYVYYLGVCRALSTQFQVPLRRLDRALWVLGTEE